MINQYKQQNNNENVDHGNDDYKPFDHEYWMEYLDFDDATVRMCYQDNADYLTDLDIHPEDIHHISTPMQSQLTQVTSFNYKKVKSNLCLAPY